ncbi:MAG: twin transmembrane helix small protein [Rhodobacteraceae bacterium]|nr:twin transmembrane helix small protein [Paracoccaceae bacterium]
MIITILNTLVAVALVGVVAVLGTGLVSFVIGGDFNRKYANKLMRLRVATQAFAVIALFLRVLVGSAGGS